MVDGHPGCQARPPARIAQTGECPLQLTDESTVLLTTQANLTYVLWVSAYNTSFLFGYLALELFLFSAHSTQAVPPLLEAVNTNGLAVFLVANVLTGLVNVSMQTMYLDARTSMLVLVGYSVAVCALAWVGRSVRLKLG